MRKLTVGDVIEIRLGSQPQGDGETGPARLLEPTEHGPHGNGWHLWKVRFVRSGALGFRWIKTEIDGLTEDELAKGYRNALMDIREWIDAKLAKEKP